MTQKVNSKFTMCNMEGKYKIYVYERPVVFTSETTILTNQLRSNKLAPN